MTMTFRSSTTASAASDTVSIATPAGVQVGDLLLGFLASNIAGVLSAPGWAGLTYQSSWGAFGGGLGTGTMWISLFWRFADAGDAAGTTYTWEAGGAVNVAAAIAAYEGAAVPAPGTRSVSAYRTSFSVTGGTTSQGGQIIPTTTPTLEIFANATAGGSGGALSLDSGTERARIDGTLPLLVSETAGGWSFPSATQIFTARLLIYPGIPAPPPGGWGVGAIRMGTN
jgi:hypothetical protein